MASVFGMFELSSPVEIMDVGAAAINEVPPYKRILDLGFGHLAAFDGDERQMEAIIRAYGQENVSFYNAFLFDGSLHDVHLCAPVSGMTSLYKPKAAALAFFNNFQNFGHVLAVEQVQTTRLDDIQGLPRLDFVKMDVQGAELVVMQNGEDRLRDCLAFQLEVSFVPLYEDQPTFGEIDVYMRQRGFVPHRFVHVKRWSIAPTVFQGNFRIGGNQLLEADVVYVRDPLRLDLLDDGQLGKMATLAHYVCGSVDLCAFLLIEMERRGLVPQGAHQTYTEQSASFA